MTVFYPYAHHLTHHKIAKMFSQISLPAIKHESFLKPLAVSFGFNYAE